MGKDTMDAFNEMDNIDALINKIKDFDLNDEQKAHLESILRGSAKLNYAIMLAHLKLTEYITRYDLKDASYNDVMNLIYPLLRPHRNILLEFNKFAQIVEKDSMKEFISCLIGFYDHAEECYLIAHPEEGGVA